MPEERRRSDPSQPKRVRDRSRKRPVVGRRRSKGDYEDKAIRRRDYENKAA